MNHKGVGVNRTALHYAIQNGHLDLALLLLDRGADANDCHVTQREGSPGSRRLQVLVPSPYCYAIELGHDGIVETMLTKGLCSADSFRVPGHRTRPLSLALQGVVTEELSRRFRIVKLLLEHGARPEDEDSLLAVRWPTAETLRELLNHGADPNGILRLPNMTYWTLLHILCAESFVGERMEKIKMVIEAGGDPNAKDRVHGPALLF